MSFIGLQLNTEYRSGKNNVIKEFFIPLLSDAVLYRRAVGFFSSTALIQISKGIAQLVKNGGRVELIASPKLSEEDIEAIVKGYEERDKVITAAVMRSVTEPKTLFEEARLNLLATLIADGKLDIKIAFPSDLKKIGMYHEKMGLIYDRQNNVVAFSGSTNETETAFIHNYEVFDVFCSWIEKDKERVEVKEKAFERLWANADSSISIIDFPEVAKEKLQAFKRDAVDYSIDEKDNEIEPEAMGNGGVIGKPKNAFRVPDITLYQYQQDAIKSWLEHDGVGIFDMATGAGKTYTGLGALAALSQKLKDKLAVFIVCPYQHLVEQWVEDIRAFNVEPIICYFKYDWEKKLKLAIADFKLGVVDGFCAIACNASFKLPKMQEQIEKLRGNTCLVVDEAHNFGSTGLQRCLSPKFKYKLALSATLERHRDEQGTQALYDYFGEKCIEFSLKDAIANGFLTPYYYYPIIVTLNDDELREYIRLTDMIIKMIRKNGGIENLPKQAEMLLIKRARIIAGAQSKVEALRQVITPYKDKDNILVYCGATRMAADDGGDGGGEADQRQIEAVTALLGKELNMRVSMFTSKEKPDERARLKAGFADGSTYQALIAIKCLDEGVNIPGIRTAFIIASSTNPKEYIQRRGRVLRKARGKDYAEIYDFVVMPHDIATASRHEILDIDAELSLVKRELERVEDFMELSLNYSNAFTVREQINEYYQTNYIKGGTDYGI